MPIEVDQHLSFKSKLHYIKLPKDYYKDFNKVSPKSWKQIEKASQQMENVEKNKKFVKQMKKFEKKHWNSWSKTVNIVKQVEFFRNHNL